MYDDCSKVSEQFGLPYYSFFSLFFRSPFRGESPTLYNPFWIIFTLHLLIIWTLSWVLVLSVTFPSFLWVALAKVALFKRLLHINATSKVVMVHLMHGVSHLLDIFKSSSFSHVRETRSCHWTFSKGHFNCYVIYFEPYSLSPRSMYSSDDHTFTLFLRNLVWESFIIICLSSDLFISLDKAQSPIYDHGPLPLHLIYNLQDLKFFFFKQGIK